MIRQFINESFARIPNTSKDVAFDTDAPLIPQKRHIQNVIATMSN